MAAAGSPSPRPTHARVGLVSLVASVALLVGCSQLTTHGLAFRDDPAVRITAPSHRVRVTAPFELRWRALRALPPGGRYEIVVDRSPQPPRAAPSELAPDDATCRRASGCPDATWYAAHGVYFTASLHITIQYVAPTSDERSNTLHEATVVVVDRDGRRHGEAAALLEFRIHRDVNGIVESG